MQIKQTSSYESKPSPEAAGRHQVQTLMFKASITLSLVAMMLFLISIPMTDESIKLGVGLTGGAIFLPAIIIFVIASLVFSEAPVDENPQKTKREGDNSWPDEDHTESSATKVTNKLEANFPEPTEENTREVVQPLKRLWEKVSAQDNTAENKYILEQIAEYDLPESYKTYTSLLEENPKLQQEAKVIFERQIELIEYKVKQIIAGINKDKISQAKAHTRYLQDKFGSEEMLKLN